MKKSGFLIKNLKTRHPFQKCHFCNFQTGNSAEHILNLKKLKSAKNLKSLDSQA